MPIRPNAIMPQKKDVERAILEPGGTVCFFAKQPVPDERRHREVMDQLEHLAMDLERLRSNPAAPES